MLTEAAPDLRLNRAARRMVNSAKAARTNPMLRDRALTERAFQILVARLEGFGNVLTEAHKEALYCIVGRFTMLANGAVKGRYAYDLPCGAGKTQAVVAWLVAVHELGLTRSVAVCASKVESLCDLKRELLAAHVPEEKIGLIHSYRVGTGAGCASLPATDGNDERPILLVTHARLRNGSSVDLYNDYRGKRRDLVIYDESLLVSDHRSVSRVGIASALGWLGPRVMAGSSTATEAAYEYLSAAWESLEVERLRQEAGGKPRTIELQRLDPAKLEEMVDAMMVMPQVTGCLAVFLRISQEPLRLAVTNQGKGGVVQYEIMVPPELDRMAILDASWPIRELERMDRSILTDPAFIGAVKTYETVTINHLRHGAGRGAMERSFGAQRREDRKISLEVCEVIAALPPDEGVLVFVFKTRDKIDMAETLRADLRAAGVDPEAVLPCGKPRLSFLTWGSETTLNAYVHCSNVILPGVVHRSDSDLAGAIIGQRDDLLGDLGYSEVLTVRRSEVAHSLYQALSRGSCRMAEAGKARPMNVWMIHPDPEIRALLSRVMPGVVWREWETKFLELDGVIDSTIKKIVSYLESLPPDQSRVATRVMKKSIDVSAVPKRTFSEAVKRAKDQLLFAWTLEGQSFVRVPA